MLRGVFRRCGPCRVWSGRSSSTSLPDVPLDPARDHNVNRERRLRLVLLELHREPSQLPRSTEHLGRLLLLDRAVELEVVEDLTNSGLGQGLEPLGVVLEAAEPSPSRTRAEEAQSSACSVL